MTCSGRSAGRRRSCRGLTVSGGEATMQAPFVADLFAAVKADPATSRLTCFVDSNGDADPDVWETLRPTMDAAMVDLKCLDPLIHAEMTGAGNHRVLETIALLHEWGKLYEVRLLMLAGVNDDDDLLRRTGDWLAIHRWADARVGDRVPQPRRAAGGAPAGGARRGRPPALRRHPREPVGLRPAA
ncbi:MAG: radical SAM protein [Ilumatobacteraceae bacterium]